MRSLIAFYRGRRHMIKTVRLMVMGVVGFSMSVWGVAPQTYYVNAESVAGDGSSWTNAFPYLQDALAVAIPFDTIKVAGGVYYPDEGAAVTNDDRTASFVIPAGVDISGGWSGSLPETNNAITVLSGDIDQNDVTNSFGVVEVDPQSALNGINSYHVVQLTQAAGKTTTLSGVTITAGRANRDLDDSGAGLLVNQAAAVLDTVTFSGNWAAYDGGGFRHDHGSALMLTNCVLVANRAARGGAASVNYADASYKSCRVTGNFGKNCSGLFSENGSVTIQNSVIKGNQGRNGSALFHQGGDHSLSAVNTLISGNRATSSSTIWMKDGVSSFINCTFSGNAASSGAGGLHALGNNTSTVYNCIFYQNEVGGQTDVPASSITNDVGAAVLVGYSLVENSGGSTNWNADVGTDLGHNLDADPNFVSGIDPALAPVTGGDFRLMLNSVVEDAGTNGVNTVYTDLAGEPRVLGPAIDLGAYELNPALFTDLAVGCTASPEVLQTSDEIFYTVDVTNRSNLALADVNITSTLSTPIESVLSSSIPLYTLTNNTLIITLPAVPANGTAQAFLTLQFASNNVTAITNTVEVSLPNTLEPTPDDNRVDEVTLLPDTDQDQVPDAFDLDDDNDGVDDLSEQIAGTDQFDANSFFTARLEQMSPGVYEIRFQTLFFKKYQVQYTTSLTNPDWHNEGSLFSGNDTEHSVPVSLSDPSRFYRVQISELLPPL